MGAQELLGGAGAQQSSRDQHARDFAALWERSRPRLLQQVEYLENTCACAARGNLEPGQIDAAVTEAHRLVGALGMFSLTDESVIARQIEGQLKLVTDLTPAQQTELSAAIATVKSAIASYSATLQVEVCPTVATVQQPVKQHNVSGEGIRIVVIVTQTKWQATSLAAEADNRCWAPQSVHSLGAAREAIAAHNPNALVVSFDGIEREDGMKFLAAVRESHPVLPVIVVSHKGNFEERLELSDRGAARYIHAWDPALIMDELDRIVTTEIDHTLRMLIVDDDEVIIDALRTGLGNERITVCAVRDPHDFPKMYQRFAPDVLVLDVNMPGIDGIRICRTVRTDPASQALPILLLSADREAETVQAAFDAGADDFIEKTESADAVCHRLLTRITRAFNTAQPARTGRRLQSGTGRTHAATEARVAIERRLVAAHSYGHELGFGQIKVEGIAAAETRFGRVAVNRALLALFNELDATFSDEVGVRVNRTTFSCAALGAHSIHMLDHMRGALDRVMHVSANGSILTVLKVTASASQFPSEGTTVQELQSAAQYSSIDLFTHRIGVGAELDVAIVEDDDTMADAVVLSLRAQGLSVMRFSSGGEALAALTGPATVPSPRVLLMDIGLPQHEDGTDLVRILRRRKTFSAAVIMMSARDTSDEVLRARNAGAVDYLLKPFEPEELTRRVRNAIAVRDAQLTAA